MAEELTKRKSNLKRMASNRVGGNGTKYVNNQGQWGPHIVNVCGSENP